MSADLACAETLLALSLAEDVPTSTRPGPPIERLPPELLLKISQFCLGNHEREHKFPEYHGFKQSSRDCLELVITKSNDQSPGVGSTCNMVNKCTENVISGFWTPYKYFDFDGGYQTQRECGPGRSRVVRMPIRGRRFVAMPAPELWQLKAPIGTLAKDHQQHELTRLIFYGLQDEIGSNMMSFNQWWKQMTDSGEIGATRTLYADFSFSEAEQPPIMHDNGFRAQAIDLRHCSKPLLKLNVVDNHQAIRVSTILPLIEDQIALVRGRLILNMKYPKLACGDDTSDLCSGADLARAVKNLAGLATGTATQVIPNTTHIRVVGFSGTNADDLGSRQKHLIFWKTHVDREKNAKRIEEGAEALGAGKVVMPVRYDNVVAVWKPNPW